MKIILLTISLFLFCSIYVFAQSGRPQHVNAADYKGPGWEFGFAYKAQVPFGAHGRVGYMNGGQFHSGMRLFKHKLLLGAEAGFSQQKAYKDWHEFTMNGLPVKGLVNATTTFYNVGFQGRYYFSSLAGFNYFITGSGGWQHSRGQLSVSDPLDDDECAVLEEARLLRDRTWYHSLGAGVSLATGWTSNEKGRGINAQIDFSVRYLRSGNLDVINMRHLHNDGEVPGMDKPVDMQFVNLRTSTVHTHRVATMRTAPLNSLMFDVTVTFAGAGKAKKRS